MFRSLKSGVAVIVVGVLTLTLSACTGDIKESVEDDIDAEIIQTLSQFNRPESAAFSLDGQYLFVANCASSPDGLREGQGAVSKLSVDQDGRLTMVSKRFTEGLTGPLGMKVLPRATEKYPAGTLFVNVGFAWVCDEDGEPVTDHDRLGTGVVAIDPDSGEILGRIKMGKGSAVAALLGYPVLGPNGFCFDDDGNMYVADAGAGGEDLDPSVSGKESIVKIEHAHIDALSEGEESGGVHFVSTEPHEPNGVRTTEDFVYYVTCDGEGPKGGAVFRVKRDDFGNQTPEPQVVGIGPMDGIVFMEDGTIIASRFAGDLVVVGTDGRVESLILDREFDGPSDIKIKQLADGNTVVIVPEQEMEADEDWEQNVHVVLIK